MPKANVFDMAGKQVGEIELPESIFGIKPNREAMRAAVLTHLAACRQGTQSTLTRAEVSGTNAKPWRQKGTGRARHGSRRSPIWTHGGIAFGPKPRSYKMSLNKKVRRIALLSALSDKAASGGIIVIESLDMEAPKTKEFSAFLGAVGAVKKPLVITPGVRRNVVLSARNIPGAQTTTADILNTYDVLNCGCILLDREAVPVIEEVYDK